MCNTRSQFVIKNEQNTCQSLQNRFTRVDLCITQLEELNKHILIFVNVVLYFNDVVFSSDGVWLRRYLIF